MRKQPKWSLRNILKGSAATLLYSGSKAVAAEGPDKIRIAQIGTSHAHAAGKMAAVSKLSDIYDVAGIAEPIESEHAHARKNAAYRDLRLMTENELLNDRSIAAVIVETTLDDSPRAALACIEAGKHIHLDKPGAASHADFASLRTRAEQLKLTVQMGYMLRYNPAFELLFVAHTSSLSPTQFRASAKFITKDFLLPPKIKLRWYIYISVPQKILDRGYHRSQDPSEP